MFAQPLFIFSIAVLASGLAVFSTKKVWLALALTVIGAFGLRVWASELDPFLHDWDERWHAVVAKNMLSTGLLSPQIRTELLIPNEELHWCCSHFWLHKPPLFLWQMAVSMAVFGKNLLAMRLPSILLGSVAPLFLFRMGKILTGSDRAGFVAAWFSAISFYQLELASGSQPVDHADASVFVWVAASFWALFEAFDSRKKRFLVAVGLFAGAAVLTKWLAGLLVFAGWGGAILLAFRVDFWKNALRWTVALAVASAVFLPWHFFAAKNFSTQFAHEQAFNFEHVRSVIEGHAGGWRFYLEAMDGYFFENSWPFVVAALAALGWRAKGHFLANCLIISVLGAWIFYSLIAQTKMASYFYLAAGPMLVALGSLSDALFLVFEKRTARLSTLLFWVPIAATAVLGFGFLNTKKLEKRHDPAKMEQDEAVRRAEKIQRTAVFKKLDAMWPVEKGVVAFVPEELDAMFFSDKLVFTWLTDELADSILAKKKPLAVPKNAKTDQWLKARPEVKVLDFEMR